MKLSTTLLGIFLVGISMNLPHAFAGGAADALLNSVAPPQATSNSEMKRQQEVPLLGAQEINMNDPVIRQLFAEVETTQQLPFDIKLWTYKVLKGQWKAAAHLWSSLSSQVPSGYKSAARIGYIYSLWHLDLPQTFMKEWLEVLTNSELNQTRAAVALEQAVSLKLDQWLLDNSIVLTPEQTLALEKVPLSQNLALLTLKGWAALRTGDKAKEILNTLPAQHKLKPYLAQTVAVALARKNDLGGAARILKLHLEPAIDVQGKPEDLAEHYLNIARLLYQAGQLDAAETFYGKIPNKAPQYLLAREELLWVWLRQGNLANLRGELTSLGSDVFKDAYAPELNMVKAISNLKMCYYSNVQKDFENFTSSNKTWAKKIDEALAASSTPVPRRVDYFTRLSEKSLDRIQNEQKRIKELQVESIQAALPAVGIQKHWVDAESSLVSLIDLAQKKKTFEYRRQWKADQLALSEAIKKMRFVKVEFLNQVNQLSKSAELKATPLASRSNAAAAQILAKEKTATLNFPFDGTVWPDEFFHLRSVAQSRCQELQAIKK